MSFSNTALFVVDIQHDLVGDPKTEIPHATRIHEAATGVLNAVRGLTSSEKPAFIVFVQHEESPESGPLVKGSEPWKLAFNPQAGLPQETIISKTTRDTFESNPQLAAQLKSWGIENIVVIGVQSECCVQATCEAALDAGFGITLLSGAHSTYDTKEQSAVQIEQLVENELRSRGAKVVPWKDAIDSWREAGLVQ